MRSDALTRAPTRQDAPDVPDEPRCAPMRPDATLPMSFASYAIERLIAIIVVGQDLLRLMQAVCALAGFPPAKTWGEIRKQLKNARALCDALADISKFTDAVEPQEEAGGGAKKAKKNKKKKQAMDRFNISEVGRPGDRSSQTSPPTSPRSTTPLHQPQSPPPA